MTDSPSALAMVLTELGWKPEVLARRLNNLATVHGRDERVHAKTPYKWLRGDRPRSPWPALMAALVSDELGRTITAADLGWGGDGEVDSTYVVGHLARLLGDLAPYRRRPAVRQLTEQAAGLVTSAAV